MTLGQSNSLIPRKETMVNHFWTTLPKSLQGLLQAVSQKQMEGKKPHLDGLTKQSQKVGPVTPGFGQGATTTAFQPQKGAFCIGEQERRSQGHSFCCCLSSLGVAGANHRGWGGELGMGLMPPPPPLTRLPLS